MNNLSDNCKVILNAMASQGRSDAEEFQKIVSTLSYDEIIANEYRIPMYNPDALYSVGFLCKTSAGNIVRLLEEYDAEGEPEENPAHWYFYWTKDPEQATPYVATSYNTDECCIYENAVWKSKIDNNTTVPNEQGWDVIKFISTESIVQEV